MLIHIDVNQHSTGGGVRAGVTLHCAMTTLGQRWRIAREALNLGMNELDRKLGQGSGYTSRVEKDEKPEIAMYIVDRAAKELSVSLDWLVRGEGEGPSLAGPIHPSASLEDSVVLQKKRSGTNHIAVGKRRPSKSAG